MLNSVDTMFVCCSDIQSYLIVLAGWASYDDMRGINGKPMWYTILVKKIISKRICDPHTIY